MLAATALLAWGASGCGDLLQEPDTGFGKLPVHLEEVSGNGQTAAPGAALDEPLRVRVRTDGEPAPRLWIEWSVLAGSGTVEPRNSFSDANGIAETRWILGPSDGSQRVQAIVREAISVTFDATAESP
ncbi:hypothetical protein BH20GEM1_BH20GEM1_00020 [soil metagenome]